LLKVKNTYKISLHNWPRSVWCISRAYFKDFIITHNTGARAYNGGSGVQGQIKLPVGSGTRDEAATLKMTGFCI